MSNDNEKAREFENQWYKNSQFDSDNIPAMMQAYSDQENAESEQRELAAYRQIKPLKKEIEELKESKFRRTEWIDKARRDAGYPLGVSFDVVWAETLAKAQETISLEERVKELEDGIRSLQKFFVEGKQPNVAYAKEIIKILLTKN